ncbi:MAG: simple sugar transport system ATP-binding protein [Chloroflexi bacterium]|nr:MAG: simple sugar transport system ATP-binding protein [Chloroflexota bacterium]
MKVEIKNIHKHFGKVHANNDISMTIQPGTIQGILGENGAGKSTLMKILSGFYQADKGEIRLDGKLTRIKSPADAIKHGVGMLHQDPLDFPPMPVIDNLIIGQSGGLLPNRKVVRKQFEDLQARFNFKIDPDAYVDSLTVGERQQLEILRLLWLGAKVLILDEPTTGISASQKEMLFATLKILASQGMSVIFVSHKLDEVEQLCNQVAVFRQGKNVGQAMPPYRTPQLVQLMFGKSMELAPRIDSTSCDVLVHMKDLAVENYRLHISGINLDICKGEVIGLAGMEGSGQRLFLQACTGLRRTVGGKLYIGQRDFTGKPYHQFLNSQVSYVPASRLEEGLISGLSLTEHFILAGEQQGFIINRDKALKLTESRIKDFSIRGIPETRVESLSGGNQQRALLALLRSPLQLLLLEHPTRGLDIESSMWIWNMLKERCKTGTAIIFTSSDLDEVLHYSDRILVFFGGKVSNPLNAGSTTVDSLGQLIGGKGWEN